MDPLKKRYEKLQAELSRLGEISQGSVMHEPPNAWRWTRKVNAKTITVALSKEQAERMKKAILNHRQMEKIITEMRQITQKLILETPPGARRRNHPKSSLS